MARTTQLPSIIPQPLQGSPLPARRAAAACRRGETAAPSSSPQTPRPRHPWDLSATPPAARVGFYNHRERPFPHVSHLLLYWEVISDYVKEEKCSLPSPAWRCCRGSGEPRVALPMPPLHEGKACFGRMAGKKKGYASGSWLRMLVSC